MAPIIVNAMVSFIVGIFSGLATHFILTLNKNKMRPAKTAPEPHWKEVFVWILLPIIYTLFTLLLIQYRWPVSLPIAIFLLFCSFLIPAALVFSIRLLSSLVKKKVVERLQGALLALGFFVGICYFFLLDHLLPDYIALNCPSKVEYRTTLKGRVIDPRWRVYVLVKPRSTDGTFVNRTSPPGKDGIWYANVHFGGGEGEEFEVYALTLSHEVSQAIKPDVLPKPHWLENNALHKTSIYVVTKS